MERKAYEQKCWCYDLFGAEVEGGREATLQPSGGAGGQGGGDQNNKYMKGRCGRYVFRVQFPAFRVPVCFSVAVPGISFDLT